MRTLLAAVLVLTVFTANATAGEKKSRIDDIKVGEWVLYKIGNDDKNTQKFTIKSISGEGDKTTIVFTIDAAMPDGSTESQDLSFTREEMFATYERYENYVVGSESVTVGGKTIEAQVTKMAVQSGQYLTIYWSYEIPFEGIIKIYADQNPDPVMEIIDFEKK